MLVLWRPEVGLQANHLCILEAWLSERGFLLWYSLYWVIHLNLCRLSYSYCKVQFLSTGMQLCFSSKAHTQNFQSNRLNHQQKYQAQSPAKVSKDKWVNVITNKLEANHVMSQNNNVYNTIIHGKERAELYWKDKH
jgi:hypothetical protein